MQNPVKDERAADGVVHDAFSVDANFQLGEPVGGNRIVLAEILRTAYASHNHGLPLGIDGDILDSLEHEVSVGQDLGHPGGKRGGELRGTAGLALTVELGASPSAARFASGPVTGNAPASEVMEFCAPDFRDELVKPLAIAEALSLTMIITMSSVW